jgi:hypothetical protein
MLIRTFTMRWSVSRARDTEGYNVLTVRDESGKKVAGCNGGGYDMEGTVLAEVLCTQFPTEMYLLANKRAHNVYPRGATPPGEWYCADDSLYGLSLNVEKKTAYVDGACGVRSVETIAEAMGIKLQWALNRRGHKVGFTLVKEGS